MYTIKELEALLLSELKDIAAKIDVKDYKRDTKEQLVYKILERQALLPESELPEKKIVVAKSPISPSPATKLQVSNTTLSDAPPAGLPIASTQPAEIPIDSQPIAMPTSPPKS